MDFKALLEKMSSIIAESEPDMGRCSGCGEKTHLDASTGFCIDCLDNIAKDQGHEDYRGVTDAPKGDLDEAVSKSAPTSPKLGYDYSHSLDSTGITVDASHPSAKYHVFQDQSGKKLHTDLSGKKMRSADGAVPGSWETIDESAKCETCGSSPCVCENSQLEEAEKDTKPTDNFTEKDLHDLESITDLGELKAAAEKLISKPSKRPMKPAKVAWFRRSLESMNNRDQILKLMYDLYMAGIGMSVLGTSSGMGKSSYQQRFGNLEETEEMCETCGSSPCVCEGVGIEEEVLDEVTPPGFKKEHPGLMGKLKKEYPGEPGKAYATAWKISGKDEEELEEGSTGGSSCWGCGQDWRERWSSDELATGEGLEHHGLEADDKICPDCVEELGGYEELDEAKKKPHTIEAHGVKGMDSKRWRKTFKDEEDLNQWLEKNDAEMYAMRELDSSEQDVYESELSSLKRMMECWGPMAAPQSQASGMNVTTNVDSKTGTKTVTVTADGEGAEELMKILAMSGIAVAPMAPQAQLSVEEELANQPNPETLDAKIQMVDMAGGPNAPHGQYNPDRGRDNSMTMMDEAVDQMAARLKAKFNSQK